jgi:ABC-type dipeptide/oligopeptide/nickel transport system ATPase subunit
MLLGKHDRGYLLRFIGLADFEILPSTRTINSYFPESLTRHTLEHLLLDHVLPRVLSLTERTVLHASAVVLDGEAIAFAGEAGWGKSTLAAAFCKLGLTHLTDDCLTICDDTGRLTATPNYSSIRLWSDSMGWVYPNNNSTDLVADYTDKRRISAKNGFAFCSDPIPVSKLYVLASPEHSRSERPVQIRSLKARECMIELIKHSYRLDITDHEKLAREFEILRRISLHEIAFQLTYPREFSLLPAVCQSVIDHMVEN